MLEKQQPSFYKKPLPSTCVAFHDKEGKAIFREAIAGDFMECYFSLSSQFLTQSEPAFCGLASLCMVLNSLEVDPLRQWKGVWRWYDESMLDCCRPLEFVKNDGITLSQFNCLAKCNGLQVEANLAEARRKEKFLGDLESVCASKDTLMVVSFSRATLGQTGDGHFSPIGGFCKKKNMVLVMDVARFKYPTYWVSIDLLWDALLPPDKDTNKSRGWSVLKRNSTIFHAYSQLSVDSETWLDIHHIIFTALPEKISLLPASATLLDYCFTFLESIPEEYDSVVENRTLMFSNLNGDKPLLETQIDQSLSSYIKGLSDLLVMVGELELYKHLLRAKSKQKRPCGKLELIDCYRKCHSLRGSPSEDGRLPVVETPRLSQMQRLMSLSAVSNRSSLTELLPVTEDLDYPTAFLTLFAFALFQVSPEMFYKRLKNQELSLKIGAMVDLANLPAEISEELKLINYQIDALNEYIKK